MEQYANNEQDSENFNFGIGYTYLLDNKIKIKEIFDVIASSKGGVLFHCTAGKDRTGVVSALILGLCNVDRKDIIANYEVTYTYISDCEFMNTYPLNMQISEPIFMNTFIQNLLEKYSNLKILNLYGPTETTMFTTCKDVRVYEMSHNYTSIGSPIYGARLAIINNNCEFMPIGIKGELIIYEDDLSIKNIARRLFKSS